MKKLDKQAIKKILVIRLDKVGDLVLSTPFLRNLRMNFPEATLSIIVTPYTAEVLQGNPNVNELIIYDPRWSSRRKYEFRKKLSKMGWDLSIALSPTTSTYFMAFYSRAPMRYGYIYSGRWVAWIVAKLLLSRLMVLKVAETLEKNGKIPHEVEQTFMFLNDMGCETVEYPLELYPGDEAVKYAKEKLEKLSSGKNIIGVHLSPKWVSGSWTHKDFHSLIRRILNANGERFVLLTYGKLEEELVENIRTEFLDETGIKIVGCEPFKNWVSLIGCCKIFLSTDTGSLHCAAAMGVPVVCLYEDKTFEHCSQQWAPWKVNNAVIRKKDPEVNIKEILEASEKILKSR